MIISDPNRQTVIYTENKEIRKTKEEESEQSAPFSCRILFVLLFIFWETIVLIFYGIYFRYTTIFTTSSTFEPLYEISGVENHIETYYTWLVDVQMIMLVGYGFLGVYLRFHRWSSLTFPFFAAMIGIQIYIIFKTFWYKCWNGGWYDKTYLNFTHLLNAVRAVISLIIALGALLGKIDIFQTLFITMIFLIGYSLNEQILFGSMNLRDAGGAIFIHTFGGFFGVITSAIYSIKSNAKDNPNNRGSYGTISLTFLGTYYLWCFFPSFNACLIQSSTMRLIAAMNTVFALMTSTTISFCLSILLGNGKLNPKHILNSTLAGGIMVAASCDFFTRPYISMLVGFFAGAWSVLSFDIIDPILQKMNIYDTRGIFHLHLGPGIWGCITSAIAIGSTTETIMGNPNLNKDLFIERGRSRQGGFQIVSLLITLGISLGASIICGLLLRIWRACNQPIDTFGDHIFWHMGSIAAKNRTANRIKEDINPYVPTMVYSPSEAAPIPIISDRY